LQNINNPDTLLLESEEVLNNLIKAGIISSDQAKSASIYDKQLVTKLFYQNEVKYHQILSKRSQGDFLDEDKIALSNFSKSNDDENSLFSKNAIDQLLGLSPESIEQIRKLDNKIKSQFGMPNEQITENQPAIILPPSLKQKSISLSTLIDRYIDNKIQEKRWKLHTTSGHLNDINLFL
jgi:hypothetical protein